MRADVIKSYVPLFLREAEPFKSIYESMGTEMDAVYTDLDTVGAQLFVTTATWGLKHWENFLDIEVNEAKSYAYRRSVVLSKLRGVGTVTKNLIQSASLSFENGTLDVLEYPADHKVVLKFTELNGVPPNFDDFEKFMREVIPAHMEFEFEYKYITHRKLSGLTHADLGAYTHETIRSTNKEF